MQQQYNLQGLSFIPYSPFRMGISWPLHQQCTTHTHTHKCSLHPKCKQNKVANSIKKNEIEILWEFFSFICVVVLFCAFRLSSIQFSSVSFSKFYFFFFSQFLLLISFYFFSLYFLFWFQRERLREKTNNKSSRNRRRIKYYTHCTIF